MVCIFDFYSLRASHSLTFMKLNSLCVALCLAIKRKADMELWPQNCWTTNETMQQVNCITLALNKRDESESVCAYCSRVLLNWSCIHILTMGYEGFLCNLIISEFVVAELILLLVLLEPVAIHFIKWWKMCHDINIWNASPNNKIAHWKLAYVKWRTVLKAGILFISTFIRSVGVAMVTYCIVLALYTVSYM